MKQNLRITPAKAIWAYSASGINPAVEEFVCGSPDRLCGCPLGALYIASHPQHTRRVTKLYNEIDRWADATYGVDYVIGFTAGYDAPQRPCVFAEGRSVEGYQDGVAVRAAVQEAYPHL